MDQLRKISAKYLFETAKENLLTYESPEKESVVYLLLEDMFQISKIDILVHKELFWDASKEHQLGIALRKLNLNTPIQYVIGKSFFYDSFFNLNADTLIPRPETEELVQLIINTNTHPAPKIIDVGTGSGCIAICLSKNIPNALVTALDISASALKMAKLNNTENKTTVQFIEMDFLKSHKNISGNFDIIVSNPPYVLESEKSSMRENVLAHEPHLALFVDDIDALTYYDALFHFATSSLAPEGYIYAEINEQKGNAMLELAKKHKITTCEIIKDMFGKDRFLKGQKN